MKLQINAKPIFGVLATLTTIFSLIVYFTIKAENKLWKQLGQNFGEK